MALPVFTSCELDQFPTDSLTEEQSWQSYSDAVNQYNGLLALLRSDVGGANAYVGDVQTDLFNQRLTSSVLSDINDWSFTGSQFSGDAVWANNYAVILQANFILQNIGKFEGNESLTAKQQADIANIKATAYFARAYAYSSMLPYYCKDYEPETANAELGLPIVEEVSSEARPARATLQATCDSIIKYMDYADQEFAKVEAYNKTASTSAKIAATTAAPNADAVTALRARHYLYMHKFDDAITEAEKIKQAYPLSRGFNNMMELWFLDQGSEIIYQPAQTADEIANTYGLYLSFNIVTENLTETNLRGMNPDYIPTKNLVDLYSDKDIRRTLYFSHKVDGHNSMILFFGTASGYGYAELGEGEDGLPVDIISTSGETVDGVIFTKFAGNPTLRKQGIWYSEIYNMSKAFRSAEANLIIAEASLRKANRDEDRAREELNDLRDARYEEYGQADEISDDVTGEALDKVMQDEWTREFVGEGYRFPCLKRWHQGFKRTPQHFDAPVLVATGGVQTLKVDANNIRFTWPIPQQDIQANKNLKQNEGY